MCATWRAENDALTGADTAQAGMRGRRCCWSVTSSTMPAMRATSRRRPASRGRRTEPADAAVRPLDPEFERRASALLDRVVEPLHHPRPMEGWTRPRKRPYEGTTAPGSNPKSWYVLGVHSTRPERCASPGADLGGIERDPDRIVCRSSFARRRDGLSVVPFVAHRGSRLTWAHPLPASLPKGLRQAVVLARLQKCNSLSSGGRPGCRRARVW